MLAITVWDLSRWRDAIPALVQIRPGAVQLHANANALVASAPRIASELRRELGASSPEVWLGVAGDAGLSRTRAKLDALAPGDGTGHARVIAALQHERTGAARVANEIGAARLVYDAEGLWKRGLPGFDAACAAELVKLLRQEFRGQVRVTSYDCPGYHSAFPWAAFDACEGWDPQVYFAPKSGLATRGAAAYRYNLHVKFWARAERDGLLRAGRARVGYLQAHHCAVDAICFAANKFADVALWAFPGRCDEHGLRAARALAEIERWGFCGPGRVEQFQRSAALTPDGVVGPKTLAALGV